MLDQIESMLQEFRVQFSRFFAGDRAVPPEDLREELKARLRQARSGPATGGVRSVADLFRLTQLEAQFNTYSELFNRRLRQREEGPRRSGAFSVIRPASPTAAMQGLSPEHVEELHQELYHGNSGDGTPDAAPSLERFGAYLQAQAEALWRRTGCSDVAFRISTGEGRRRLLVRPIGGSSPEPTSD